MGVNEHALRMQKRKTWRSLLPDQHRVTIPPTETYSAQPFLQLQRHNLWHPPPLITPCIKRDQQTFSVTAASMLCKDKLCKALSPPPVVIDKWEQEYRHQMVSGSVGEVEGHIHHGLFQSMPLLHLHMVPLLCLQSGAISPHHCFADSEAEMRRTND